MYHDHFEAVNNTNQPTIYVLGSKLLKVRLTQNVFMKSSIFQNTTEKIW